jgi:hypothetical protein
MRAVSRLLASSKAAKIPSSSSTRCFSSGSLQDAGSLSQPMTTLRSQHDRVSQAGGSDKLSLVFQAGNDGPGSLSSVLSLIAKHGISLSRIESRPSIRCVLYACPAFRGASLRRLRAKPQPGLTSRGFLRSPRRSKNYEFAIDFVGSAASPSVSWPHTVPPLPPVLLTPHTHTHADGRAAGGPPDCHELRLPRRAQARALVPHLHRGGGLLLH